MATEVSRRGGDARGRAYVELELQPIADAAAAPASPVQFLRVYHDDDVDAVCKQIEPHGGPTSPLREAIQQGVLDATRLELQFATAERDAFLRKEAKAKEAVVGTAAAAAAAAVVVAAAAAVPQQTKPTPQQTFAEEKAKILQREVNSLRGEKLDKLRYYRGASHTSLVPPGKEAAHRLAVMLQRRAYNLEEETRTLRDHVATWRRRAVDAERQISALETKVRLQDSIYSAPTLTSSHMVTLQRNNTVLQTRIASLELDLARALEQQDSSRRGNLRSAGPATSGSPASGSQELEQAHRDIAELKAKLQMVTESRDQDISSAVQRAIAMLPGQDAMLLGQEGVEMRAPANVLSVEASVVIPAKPAPAAAPPAIPALDPSRFALPPPRTPDRLGEQTRPTWGTMDATAAENASSSYQRVRHLTPDRELFVLREELKRLLKESDSERVAHERDLYSLREELRRTRADLQKRHWRRSER